MKLTNLIMLFFITATTIINAQHIYVESGKSSTLFDYRNSNGVASLDNLQTTSNDFMEIGYSQNLFGPKSHVSIGFNYAGYGAVNSDINGNYMTWDLNYAGATMGIDFTLTHFRKLQLYYYAGVTSKAFVDGYQTINNSVYNMENDEDFDTTMTSARHGLGLSHPISDNLSFYVQYMVGKSQDILDGDDILKIENTNLSFGLFIDVSRQKEENKEKENNN